MSLVGFKAQNHPQQKAKPQVDDRGTTWEVFDPLNARFRFTLDAAAAPHNRKVARYFTVDDDGLTQPWAGQRVWCNPPYSDIGPWLEKAWYEWGGTPQSVGLRRAELIVMLLPANRTEQGWWQRWVEPYRDLSAGFRCEFLKGRMRFIREGCDEVKPNDRPPFGCCLLIWETP